MKKRYLSTLFILLSISLAGCDLSGFNFYDSSTNSQSANTEETSSSSQVEVEYSNRVIEIEKTSTSETSTVIDAIEKVYDSVVVINAYTANSRGAGAGIIIGKENDGNNYFIVTCHHVIEDATRFEVILSNETKLDATLVGGDPTTDIAVLMVTSEETLTVSAFLEDSNTLKLGQTAIAIGNPLGTLANTVTCGIVSSLKRSITFSDGTTMELLQTDAAINSGNSGGGLFDIGGNLIGVVNAKYSSSGVEGLGFAIPSNTASKISNDLITYGYVPGRYLFGATISDGVYYERWYEQARVVYVDSVLTNSSAYGILKANDIITGVKIIYADETKEALTLSSFTTASEVNSFITNANLAIGDQIEFNVTRNSSKQTVTVTLKQYKYEI